MLISDEIKEQIQAKILELLQYGEITRKSATTIRTSVTKNVIGRPFKTVETNQTVSSTESKPTPLPLLMFLIKVMEIEEAIALLIKNGFDVQIRDAEVMRQWINNQNVDNPLEPINQGFTDETIDQIKAQVLELD